MGLAGGTVRARGGPPGSGSRRPEQGEADGVHDDREVVELAEQGDAELFNLSVDRLVATGPGEEDDPDRLVFPDIQQGVVHLRDRLGTESIPL